MIQVNLCGEVAEVHAFVNYLEEQPIFKVEPKSAEDRDQLVYQELTLTTSLLKPSLRKLHTVQLVSEDYQKIVIVLMDAEVKQEGKVVTITGLNYDIFG